MSVTLLMQLTERRNIATVRTVMRECRKQDIIYSTKMLDGGNFIKISCNDEAKEVEFTKIIKDWSRPTSTLPGVSYEHR